tara:strand:+ start:131 stop:577 length:447 start_codon:yes stop_codon:yes gene_type:complete
MSQKKFTKENVLCINSKCKNDIELKEFLFTEDLKENKCEICKQLPIWNSKKLEMIIHKKIKKNNNILDNLLILCPNCFHQKQPIKKERESKKCIDCGKMFFSVNKKISLDPSTDLINTKKSKFFYQQIRCNICLKQSITQKDKQYKII